MVPTAAAKVFAMTSADVTRLLSAESASIVRHLGKVESIANNARCIQQLIRDADASGTPTPPHGHFDALLWSYVGGSPILNSWSSKEAIPSESEAATAMCVPPARKLLRPLACIDLVVLRAPLRIARCCDDACPPPYSYLMPALLMLPLLAGRRI